MKKSYIKLITFSSFIILLCILNSFLLKKFNTSLLVIFTFILLVITKFTFGFEKDRHRYIKDIILEIIIDLIAFFLLFYLSGIIIGFARVDNYLTTKAMLDIIIPLIVYIIIKEYLRYILITKASESKALMILMTITIICLDNTIAFSMSNLTISKDTFLLIALTFIPSIAENILCSWITYHFGYKPNIVYLLIVKLYSYLLPIIPNPNEYVYSIIFFLLPIIILLKLIKWYLKDRVDEEVERVKRKQIIYYLPIITLVIILVYLVSGYFKYYAIAIASGSMEPNISKGDVVIVNQDYDSKDLAKGTIIAYKYNNKVIVHRINDIIKKDNIIIIYTKGDANNETDAWKVTEDMIVGTVNFKLPKIGYPTIWLNECWQGGEI